MADSRIVIYSLIGFIFGIYIFFKGFGWLKLKRLIENMPTSKIRSLAMGLVEIYGEVVPAQGRLLKSPLTGKDCVYYKYYIQEYRGSGKHRRWVTIKSDTNMAHFFIKDESGIVLIEPKNAQIDIPPDFNFQSGLGKDPPKIITGFLKANGLSFESLFGMNKRMKFVECFIAPKDRLYVIGTAGDNPFVEEATASNNTADIMVQKGNSSIYYISDKPENEILKAFRWKTFASLYGGAALSVICLAVIFLYFGIL